MRFSPHHLFTSEITLALILFLLKDSSVVVAQEGASVTPTGNTNSKPYNCDPATCQIAHNCLCASKNPPNNFSPQDTPQFVTVTFDDSIQPTLIQTAYDLLNVTFTSMQYTDFSLVQQWYSAGHEIADHTFNHVGDPSENEITSCRTMLNTYGGVPNGKIQGFRAPFLNFTGTTLTVLKKQGFTYDSSASAIPDDAYWPYTLDHGMANNCWTGVCDTQIPGLWEIPMYAVPDATGIPQLMDVYMAGSPQDVTKWSTDAFDKHYNGGRQPFGIYIHPTHLTGYPGLPDPKPKLDGLIAFIKSIADRPDVWFVTNQQLLQWMKNPVKASELKNQSFLKCQQPVIAKEICNGLDDNGNGQIDEELTTVCNFGTTTFKTCFNCPSTAPTLDNPTPDPSVQNGTAGYRYPLPDNCDTQWWDPIGNSCLCTSSDCQYKDTAVPVSDSGQNGKDGEGSSASGAASTLGESSAYLILATSIYAWL
ncbi:hypothetical protein BDB00DRAFT_764357 [Zychaea mexicana]|uniref:uncharacterized protein n=1 Tax=Zychaea mexicana TaxID=64656 RepID=UPI0022FE1654|nr:uncharacterized protein BDB00DRAFT_764357 [Zychaea mexicana]KAI9493025.1 hypothetical protein BDB00DRAFT_764357 [Zychaea mexicana]